MLFKIRSLFLGYYNSKEDYYNKTQCGWFGGWKYSGKFCGFDFHDNLNPDFTANGTYSTYLYEKKTLQLINQHDYSKVRKLIF